MLNGLPALIVRAMRITVFLTLTCVVNLYATAYSQDAQLTLNLKDVKLSEVFSIIKQETDYQFLYNDEEIQKAPAINLSVKDATVPEILEACFRHYALKYKIVNKTVVVSRGKPKHDLMLRSAALMDPQFAVRGRVTGSSGEPLPGVSINLRGSETGTITDAQGRYSILLPDGEGILVFSYIGFEKKSVPIQGHQQIDVTLVSSVSSLNQLVVVGYGTQKKDDLTGAISALSTKDFNAGVNVSLDQLMQGKAAGVQVSQTSGEPGGGVSVRIRGSSSINAGNEPLYVVDGLPIDNSSLLPGGGGAGLASDNNPKNPLNSINPNDIASIEILKDASATAIYGSRGANGVVLITTKKGHSGKIQVNYDSYAGTQTVAKKIPILSTSEYIDVVNSISEAGGNGVVFSPEDIASIGKGTNWQDEIYQKALVTNHDLSLAGGNDRTTFRASLNYFDQAGVVKKTGITKYIGRLNLTTHVGKRIEVGINVNRSLIKENNESDGVNVNEQAGPINAALLYDPTEPVYNADGSFSRSSNLTINNPLSLVYGITNNDLINRTLGSLYIQYDLDKHLSAKLNFGYDDQSQRRNIYNSSLTINGSAKAGIANVAQLDQSNQLVEYTMHYSNHFGRYHDINVLGGITYQDFLISQFAGSISGFPSDVLGVNNLGLGNASYATVTSDKEGNSLLSYIGRVNYSYHDKYLLTGTLRADGSSRFGTNNKFGYFPSFALGWKLDKEKFIPDLFDQLKLRASWGVTGNQDIGNYKALSTFSTGGNAIFNDKPVSSLTPSGIANPNLQWESTRQIDLGIDASILGGRLSATFDVFDKKTKEMLINNPLPTGTGYSAILSNTGQMRNSGFEAQLSAVNVDTKRFTWSTSVNLSAIRNKVLDLGPNGDIITGSVQFVDNTAIYRVGEPMASYYGYIVTGIFQTAEEVAASAQSTAQPGYPIFKDVNGDGKITSADRVVLGNPYPKFIFGLQNSLTYQGFELNFFIQGEQGADLLNINRLEGMYPANFRRNRIAEQALNRWTPTNTKTRWPSGIDPSAYGGGKVNSLVIDDASYIRLNTAQLAYNIPVKFAQSLRVYVTGQNLFTITHYIGSNPDASSFGTNNVRLDYNGYPLARTWLLGVNVGF